MNFEEFRAYIADALKYYLPKEYSEIETGKVTKTNVTYNCIKVRIDEETQKCINIDYAYELFQNGEKIEDILKGMANAVKGESMTVDADWITDYSKVKDNLFVKVISAEKNAELLESVPHKRFLDLAFVYQIKIETNKGEARANINKALFEQYGITIDQFHEDALKSSVNLCPADIDTMSGKYIEILKSKNDDGQHISMAELADVFKSFEMEKESPLYVVTNKDNWNGASAIFYPGLAKEISKNMGGSFYIIPSSIHETLAIGMDGELGRDELHDLIKMTNKDTVEPEDRLSDTLYYYDSENDEIRIAIIEE